MEMWNCNFGVVLSNYVKLCIILVVTCYNPTWDLQNQSHSDRCLACRGFREPLWRKWSVTNIAENGPSAFSKLFRLIESAQVSKYHLWFVGFGFRTQQVFGTLPCHWPLYPWITDRICQLQMTGSCVRNDNREPDRWPEWSPGTPNSSQPACWKRKQSSAEKV